MYCFIRLLLSFFQRNFSVFSYITLYLGNFMLPLRRNKWLWTVVLHRHTVSVLYFWISPSHHPRLADMSPKFISIGGETRPDPALTVLLRYHLCPLYLPFHPPPRALTEEGTPGLSTCAWTPIICWPFFWAQVSTQESWAETESCRGRKLAAGIRYVPDFTVCQLCPAVPEKNAEVLKKRKSFLTLCLQSKTIYFIIFKHYWAT